MRQASRNDLEGHQMTLRDEMIAAGAEAIWAQVQDWPPENHRTSAEAALDAFVDKLQETITRAADPGLIAQTHLDAVIGEIRHPVSEWSSQ